jgi:hypothetical protein
MDGDASGERVNHEPNLGGLEIAEHSFAARVS